MIDFTAAEIAQITGGELAANPHLTPASVVTDSREAGPGSLYVAKAGEQADGHDFIASAFAAGAVLTLAERLVTDGDGLPYPSVIVPDAVLAMGALAAAAVERIRQAREQRGDEFSVVGITGSAGKTTTKDLLAGILSVQGPTVAPQGSYNGEVGVPLTVFQATVDTRYLVIEMGATGIGHIEYLCGMVRPEVGVVLCVGTAHAGEFGGVENTSRSPRASSPRRSPRTAPSSSTSTTTASPPCGTAPWRPSWASARTAPPLPASGPRTSHWTTPASRCSTCTSRTGPPTGSRPG
ncbi:UDP-N-acetylmuramyl pentapeptide synthase [Arthrobacter woluwensis]|nr:UDP-N-acetylmuramyl pentapeptide synthase [Arthrobacter woluwensis]